MTHERHFVLVVVLDALPPLRVIFRCLHTQRLNPKRRPFSRLKKRLFWTGLQRKTTLKWWLVPFLLLAHELAHLYEDKVTRLIRLLAPLLYLLLIKLIYEVVGNPERGLPLLLWYPVIMIGFTS